MAAAHEQEKEQTDEEFWAQIDRETAEREAHCNEQIRLAGDATLVVLRSPKSTYFYVVHRSTKHPGYWQLTWFDSKAMDCRGECNHPHLPGFDPAGDSRMDSRDNGIRSACGMRNGNNPPHGNSTYSITEVRK